MSISLLTLITPITNAYTESLNSLIRVINRLGRGYSFEALRAKILFTHGSHKKTKPSFKRKHGVMKKSTGWDLADNFYGITDDNLFEKPKNYGAEISTLIELFEKEKF